MRIWGCLKIVIPFTMCIFMGNCNHKPMDFEVPGTYIQCSSIFHIMKHWIYGTLES